MVVDQNIRHSYNLVEEIEEEFVELIEEEYHFLHDNAVPITIVLTVIVLLSLFVPTILLYSLPRTNDDNNDNEKNKKRY